MTPSALAAMNGRPHPFDWSPPLYVYVEPELVETWREAGYVALGGATGGLVAMLFAPELG